MEFWQGSVFGLGFYCYGGEGDRSGVGYYPWEQWEANHRGAHAIQEYSARRHNYSSHGRLDTHLPEIGNRAIATAQSVALIQLEPDEAAEMNKGFPVVTNLSAGWFVFPPTPESNALKMARHGHGYEAWQSSSASSYSVPRVTLKQQGQLLPDDA